MMGWVIGRRKLLAMGAMVLLAGCQVIPDGGQPGTTPVPGQGPSDTVLPDDQGRHRVALLVPTSGGNAAVGEAIANATTMALLDTNASNLRTQALLARGRVMPMRMVGMAMARKHMTTLAAW